MTTALNWTIMISAAYFGLYLGILWDRYTIRKNWKGWHID